MTALFAGAALIGLNGAPIWGALGFLIMPFAYSCKAKPTGSCPFLNMFFFPGVFSLSKTLRGVYASSGCCWLCAFLLSTSMTCFLAMPIASLISATLGAAYYYGVLLFLRNSSFLARISSIIARCLSSFSFLSFSYFSCLSILSFSRLLGAYLAWAL